MIFRSSTRARVGSSGRRSPSSWPSRMSGRRPRRSPLGPRPLSAVRTSVQLVGRTSGVQAPGVHATGAIRVSGQTGVWCPRPLHPSCPHRAGSGIHRCGGAGHVERTRLDVSLWSVSGLLIVARIGPGGEGMVQRWQCVARMSVEGRAGPPLTQPPGMRAGSGAELAAWRPRELTRRQSAGGARKEQVLTKLPRRCVLGGLSA
jgi:hypothetical protein